MLLPGQLVDFNLKKTLRHIRPLGAGGTGETYLFKDETTGMLFAIKKYSPCAGNDREENYIRFVDEIKILFNLSHPNIVRVYNHYLYPEYQKGYLQMEYIEGKPINEFRPITKDWGAFFVEAVSAFKYLEENGILHRDIRAANILIDRQEQLKVIDFGFGKALGPNESAGKSVLLNWPVTELPEEVNREGRYTHQSEVYFLGKLFKSLPVDDHTVLAQAPFQYHHILDKMTQTETAQRYKSFAEVSAAISRGILATTYFSKDEKQVYQRLADYLFNAIEYFTDKLLFITDVQMVLNNLAELLRANALEDTIRDSTRLVNCFLISLYANNREIGSLPTEDVVKFHNMLNSFPKNKQEIVMENIWARLENISVVLPLDDEYLPF